MRGTKVPLEVKILGIATYILTTKSFIKEVLEYCENKPKFIIDKAWLIDALKSLNLEFEHQSFLKGAWLNQCFLL